jgi:hypothetical protein
VDRDMTSDFPNVSSMLRGGASFQALNRSGNEAEILGSAGIGRNAVILRAVAGSTPATTAGAGAPYNRALVGR